VSYLLQLIDMYAMTADDSYQGPYMEGENILCSSRAMRHKLHLRQAYTWRRCRTHVTFALVRGWYMICTKLLLCEIGILVPVDC